MIVKIKDIIIFKNKKHFKKISYNNKCLIKFLKL